MKTPDEIRFIVAKPFPAANRRFGVGATVAAEDVAEGPLPWQDLVNRGFVVPAPPADAKADVAADVVIPPGGEAPPAHPAADDPAAADPPPPDPGPGAPPGTPIRRPAKAVTA